MTNPKASVTYKDAGVDIEAGNRFVERIKPAVAATQRSECSDEIGGFGGLFDLSKSRFNNPVLVGATDGVGTKLFIANAMNTHDTIGIDLVAMCVNDLVVQGAEPLFFLDYIATSALDEAQLADVVLGIAEGCKQAGAALIGGETAEMPGLYKQGEYDVAGFAVGAVEKGDLLPRKDDITAGDVILALPSSGIHSNGYSLVRKLLETNNIRYTDSIDALSGTQAGEALLTPTRIYVKECLEMAETGHVKALAHITGGGITENLPRVLPSNISAEINLDAWQRPALFSWLQGLGNVANSEMLRTFNCGLGMMLVCEADTADILQSLCPDALQVGVITNKAGGAVQYSGTF